MNAAVRFATGSARCMQLHIARKILHFKAMPVGKESFDKVDIFIIHEYSMGTIRGKRRTVSADAAAENTPTLETAHVAHPLREPPCCRRTGFAAIGST